jgi:hypothetical protein
MEAHEIDPARPEPMPVNQPGGFEVVPMIVAEINYMLGTLLVDGGKTLIDWPTRRSEFGFNKYGARLTYPNGRDFHKDLCDELADAVNYARGAMEAGQISNRTYAALLVLADRVVNGKELPE